MAEAPGLPGSQMLYMLVAFVLVTIGLEAVKTEKLTSGFLRQSSLEAVLMEAPRHPASSSSNHQQDHYSRATTSVDNPAPSGKTTTPDPSGSTTASSDPVEKTMTTTAPSDELPLTDPLHTPRLEHFTDMDHFPTPQFHGCTEEKGLCKYSNVCYSQRDNMLVMDVPNLQDLSVDKEWYLPNSAYASQLFDYRRPLLVDRQTMRNLTNVYFAKTVFAMNCGQQPEGGYNPSHMMYGAGDLFVHSSKRWDLPGEEHVTFDLALYHQCSTVETWPWGKYINDLIWMDAIGEFTLRPPLRDALMYLPWGDNVLDPQRDPIVCGETVYQAPHQIGTYFDTNHIKATTRWQGLVSHLFATDPDLQKYLAQQPPPPDSYQDDEQGSCAQKLRIASWQRTSGSALRLFRNMDEVQALVEEYTDQPFRKLDANSWTPPQEQVAFFRSFDIMITPHGSHLVNMVFNGMKSTFIEVTPVFVDGTPHVGGMAFAKEWIPSVGHLPFNRSDLVAKMEVCDNMDIRDDGPCPIEIRDDFKNQDLIVNITVLRGHLEQAISGFCPDAVFPSSKKR